MPLTVTAGVDYAGSTLDHLIAELEGEDDDDFDDDDLDAHDAEDEEDEDDDLAEFEHEDEEEGLEIETNVKSDTHAGGPFFTFTLEPIEKLAVTVSGRYDVTHLKITDRLAGDDDDDGTDASGAHTL